MSETAGDEKKSDDKKSDDKKSYARILRTTSLLGLASIMNVLLGLVRTKVIAQLLGPAGVGALGLLSNVMQTAGRVAGLGLNDAGARQLAFTKGDDDTIGPEVVVARRALAMATAVLGLLGGAGMWVLRTPLSEWVFGDASHATEVGWMGVGVAMLVVAGSQSALLTGLRRIDLLARMQVSSAALSTLASIGLVVLYRHDAIVAIVLMPPLATLLMGYAFITRVPRPTGIKASFGELAGHWKALAALGVPLMLSGFTELASQLLLRVILQRELGLDALGHFQASWAIAATYMSFVLSSMSRDYMPRLSAKMHEPETVRRLVDEQSEVSLLLIGPLVLGMLAVAPWLIPVLYSSKFGPAVEVLRWQLLGDLFRVAGWSFSFVLLAAGMGTVHLFKTVWLNLVLLGVTWLTASHLGVQAAGVAFMVMTASHLPLILWLVYLRVDYRWSPKLRRHTAALVVAGALLTALSRWSALAGLLVGAPVAALLGLYSLARVGSLVDLPGRLGRLTKLCQRLMARFDP